MDIDLKSKHAIVCGSTQGIGLAIAQELAVLGSNVVLVARNSDKLQEVVKTLDTSSGQAHAFLCADFSNPDQLRDVIEKHLATATQVDILVNNTGGPPAGSALDATGEAFLTAFNQHLICNQILVQSVVPFMKQGNYGRIINVVSTSVKIPIPGLGVSNTIRGAVASWSKTLSLELAPWGITVNNVLPGLTQTGRLESLIKNKAESTGTSEEAVRKAMLQDIPAGYFADPSDLAAAVAFLASPAARYINGVNLPVDGGKTGSL